MNVVLHRGNLGAIEEIIALAEKLEADRLELANVQFHGFAFENRATLMPSIEELERAQKIAEHAKQRLAKKMDVLFVKPDHFSKHPRACMDGWANRFVQVLSRRHGGAVSCGVDDHVALVRARVADALARCDLGECRPR